jgi:hypothetical protein
MSTPTQPRTAAPAVPAVIPSPRQSAESSAQSSAQAPATRVPQYATWDGGEPSRVYGKHPWLMGATGVALVIAVFVSMILLNWIAGGGTPFGQ